MSLPEYNDIDRPCRGERPGQTLSMKKPSDKPGTIQTPIWVVVKYHYQKMKPDQEARIVA